MEKKSIIGIVVAVIILAVLVWMFYPSTNVEQSSTSSESSPGQMQATYMDVSAAQAKDLIDSNPNLIVIDVSPHWAEGHLPRAVSYYPSSALQSAINSGELDPNDEYLVYCHADGPSRNGAQALIDAGFTTVYRLESHFGGWESAGYEIEM